MKITATILLATAISCPAPILIRPGTIGGDSGTELVRQSFEGVGYDNGETWTTYSSDPDPDSTANALDGSESLYLDGTNDRVITSFAAQDEVWLYGSFYHASGSSSTRDLITLFKDGTGDIAYAQTTSAGNLEIVCGTVNGGTAAALSTSTRYYIWLHYVAGTGSNAQLHVYLSTTTTKPGTPTDSITNGDATSQVDRLLIGPQSATGGSDNYWDTILVDTAVIGSAPW